MGTYRARLTHFWVPRARTDVWTSLGITHTGFCSRRRMVMDVAGRCRSDAYRGCRCRGSVGIGGSSGTPFTVATPAPRPDCDIVMGSQLYRAYRSLARSSLPAQRRQIGPDWTLIHLQ